MTRHSGRITITPPLVWSQIKGSPYMPENKLKPCDVKFDIDTHVEDTPIGTLTTYTAVAVIPAKTEEWNLYDLAEDLQQLVDQFPDHEFAGHIDGSNGDDEQWRYVINDRTVVRQTPRLVWPEDADDDTRAVRLLTTAVSQLISDWAESNEPRRRELWQNMAERSDTLFDLFRDRFSGLDARAMAEIQKSNRDALARTFGDWELPTADSKETPPMSEPDIPIATLLRTPYDWCIALGVDIADADGWRGGPLPARDWDEPITVTEFAARFGECTARADEGIRYLLQLAARQYKP